MDRRVIAELPGWGVLASLPVSAIFGWRRLSDRELVTAASAMMVAQGLLSIDEAGAATFSVRAAGTASRP